MSGRVFMKLRLPGLLTAGDSDPARTAEAEVNSPSSGESTTGMDSANLSDLPKGPFWGKDYKAQLEE